jgi:hypothetical protein
MRTYSELIKLKTFDERFQYLRIGNGVGYETFGPNRYLNQSFYHSAEWKRFRDYIITRDLGCDMGLAGFEILERPIIHHINPLVVDDIIEHSNSLLDPENAITVCLATHNAIHYGRFNNEPLFTERKPGDTKLW